MIGKGEHKWNDEGCTEKKDFICKKSIPYCGVPGNVVAAETFGKDYYLDRRVQYVCNQGYYGGGDIMCEKDGKWSSKPQCDKVKCGDPGAPVGSVQKGPGFAFGDKLTYTCIKGHFKAAGNTTRTCQADR